MAVAETACPAVTVTPVSVAEKVALPPLFVVTVVAPRYTAPSPWPLLSPVGEL